MLDVKPMKVLRDTLGTAEGLCLRCGAYFSVTIPSDHSATEELERLFDKHMAEKHPDTKREGR
jgi:hypothetical protein